MKGLRKKVVNYLTQKVSIPADTAVDEPLMKQAGVDSLQLIELIIWIEKETNRPVEMEELLSDNDITIDGMVKYITKYSPPPIKQY